MVPSPVLKPAIPERSFVVSSSWLHQQWSQSFPWMANKRGERQIYGFLDAQVPCWLQSGFHTCQGCSREVPWYLVLNSSSISLGTGECRSMEAISSAQLPSQAVTLKTPPQKQSTMLLSAHKHSDLNHVETLCLQNPESLGFSSYSQALLQFMAFFFVIIFIITIIIISKSILWERRSYSSCTANTSKHIYLFLQY